MVREGRHVKITQEKRGNENSKKGDFFEGGIYFIVLFKSEMPEHVTIGYREVSSKGEVEGREQRGDN